MKFALRPLKDTPQGFYLLLGGFAVMLALGLGAVGYIEHHGHIVTGMNNQIVWGLPHVFAVFLVVAASGALNIASMSSVFGKTEFKPLAPLSALLAIALLIGGLMVLMLDLGRPDRLIIAMTYFNFKSIFAMNIFLYSGFVGFVVAYLWTMMERRMNRFTPLAGFMAFIWRMALTTGTGSIFGFLVARQAYDSALLAPLFIALSLSYGLAVFIWVLMLASKGSARPLGDVLMARLARLQVIFIAAGFYFVLVYHLTNLYFTKHHDFERFILLDGGIYTRHVLARSNRAGHGAAAGLAAVARHRRPAQPHRGQRRTGDSGRFCADVRHHHRRSGLWPGAVPGLPGEQQFF